MIIVLVLFEIVSFKYCNIFSKSNIMHNVIEKIVQTLHVLFGYLFENLLYMKTNINF